MLMNDRTAVEHVTRMWMGLSPTSAKHHEELI